MKLHPACGCPTPFIAKIIAICDLIFGLIGIFWFIYILEGYDLLMKDPAAPFTSIEATTPTNILNVTDQGHNGIFSDTNTGIFQLNGKSLNILLSAFYTIVNLVAFVLLLSAASDKNICKLKTWFGIRLTIVLLKVVLYIGYIVLGAKLYDQIPHILFMGIHLYGLWVVGVFIAEIKEERKTKVDENSVSYTVQTPK